jgi:hypothetical protein
MSSNAVNFFDDASNEIYFTGVQLEVGEFDSTSIPSFPFESFANNLSKCQRYFCDSGTSGTAFITGAFNGSASPWRFYYPKTMRAVPSGTVAGTINTDYKLYHNGSFKTLTNVYFGTSTEDSTKVEVDSSNQFTQGYIGHFYFTTTTGKFKFDAEL